jgi:hypothetical protein
MPENGDGAPEPPAPGEAQTFACPDCGEPIQAAPGPVPRLLDCPACEERFLIPALDGSTDLPTDPEPTEAEHAARAQSELDGLRMRHMVVTRRTAIRSRTYAILGAALCVMGAVKLVMMTVQDIRAAGWGRWPAAFMIGAIACCCGMAYFLGRAAHWQRESRAEKMPEPETPPDFSTLSDGSQYAKNLENLD